MSSSTLTAIAGVLVAIVFGTVGLVAVVCGAAASSTASAALNTLAIPIPSLIPVLEAAGAICSGVSAPLLAAQIEIESGWNPKAVSPKGAEGIAQFMPATFGVYGQDDDGLGPPSPFDEVDAVMAMGRYDCSLLNDVAGLASAPSVSLMLAAYNAGVGAVLEYGNTPPYPETEAYITNVESLVGSFWAAFSGGTATAFGQMVVSAASEQLGVPYSWGGGNASGPTLGSGTGAGTVGFDCSGLVLFAIGQASGGKIVLPHSSELQATSGKSASWATMEPGDVIAFALGSIATDFDHVGIYVGNNEMIDAPNTGGVVRIDTLNSYWTSLPSVIRSFR